jgi:hypothetical protein
MQFILHADYRLCITWIIHQQLWGYKVEEKLHLGVREQNRLNFLLVVKRTRKKRVPGTFLLSYGWVINKSGFDCCEDEVIILSHIVQYSWGPARLFWTRGKGLVPPGASFAVESSYTCRITHTGKSPWRILYAHDHNSLCCRGIWSKRSKNVLSLHITYIPLRVRQTSRDVIRRSMLRYAFSVRSVAWAEHRLDNHSCEWESLKIEGNSE